MEELQEEFLLENWKDLKVVARLRNEISIKSGKIPQNLSFSIDVGGVVTKYFLAADEHLKELQMYNDKYPTQMIRFYFSYTENILVSPSLDFVVLQENGISQFDMIASGQTIRKEWVIKCSSSLNEICLVCTEGELRGWTINGFAKGNNIYNFEIDVAIQGNPRLVSTFWRAFTQGFYFGPLLWIEAIIN